MLDLVEIALDKGDIHFVRLDGKMVRKDRDNAIQVFKNDDKIRCCLFSLKAGGVGLNLVWATHVYLLDPWWNPSIEDQAINRVHRIGQERDVVVNRFIIKNTIENRIMSLQRNKTQLAQGLGMSDGGIEEMSFGMTKKDLQQIRLEDLKLMFDDVNHSDDEYESEDFDE
jgi:SNF2 family DNA or RNA helicase